MLLSTGACPFCGNGNNTPCFALYDNGYYCFSCGIKKSCAKENYAFRENIIQKVALKIPNVTCDFSPTVLQWLYKYYVFENLIKKYKIYYVPGDELSNESLLLGVYDKNELVFWQRRFFPTKKFTTGGDKNTLFTINNTARKTIVLVEDYISAIRVGEHANVLCLWGIHVNYVMSKYLQKIDMNILIWLDPDEAGRAASKELLNRLSKNAQNGSIYRAFAIREQRTVSILETEKQPKDYSDQQLKEILNEFI